MRFSVAALLILSSPAWAQTRDPQIVRDIRNHIMGYATAKGMSEEELARSLHTSVSNLEDSCYGSYTLSGNFDDCEMPFYQKK